MVKVYDYAIYTKEVAHFFLKRKQSYNDRNTVDMQQLFFVVSKRKSMLRKWSFY